MEVKLKKVVIFISFVLSCTYDSIYCPKCPSYQSPSFIIKMYNDHNNDLDFITRIVLIPNDTINYMNYFRYRKVDPDTGFLLYDWTSWTKVKGNSPYYYDRYYSLRFTCPVFVANIQQRLYEFQTCYDTLFGEIFDTVLTFNVPCL